MSNTRVKKKSNSVKKRLIIYIAISIITLLIIIPLTYKTYCNDDNNLDWLNIVIDILLAFFSGSIFAIIVDIIPFYSEKRLCKKSLTSLISFCFSELENIENYDAKQLILDKYYEIFRDFFLIHSSIIGETSFECLKKLDEIKVKKLTSLEPTFSKQHLMELKNTFESWLMLF